MLLSLNLCSQTIIASVERRLTSQRDSEVTYVTAYSLVLSKRYCLHRQDSILLIQVRNHICYYLSLHTSKLYLFSLRMSDLLNVSWNPQGLLLSLPYFLTMLASVEKGQSSYARSMITHINTTERELCKKRPISATKASLLMRMSI